MRRSAVLAVCLFGCLAPAAVAAQVVPSAGPDYRSLYLAEVSSKIGTTLRAWAQAINRGDAAAAARLVDADVHVQHADGRTVRGRSAVQAEYAAVQGRVRNVEVEKLDVVQSGGLAFVSGRLRYEVQAVGGGSYMRELPVAMAFREHRGGWLLASQVGGDFAPRARAARPAAIAAPGAADTLAVVVTDASGLPMAGVRVAFEVLAGDGRLSATSAQTDAQGIARAAFTAGAQPGRAVVRATAQVLEEEPVTFDAVIAAP